VSDEERKPDAQTDDKRVEALLEAGSEIAGSVTGAAIGLLAAGPPGALLGATAGPIVARLVRRVGGELQERVLGERERARVGAAAAYALTNIKGLLEEGQELRQDGFFEAADGAERPAAEEVFEGVLLRARDAYEEKKIEYLGYLFTTVAFRPEISAADANQILAIADRLTYRQLVVLAVLSDEDDRARLRDRDYRSEEDRRRLTVAEIGLLTEVYSLQQQALVMHESGSVMLGITDVKPRKLRPSGIGQVVYGAMGLRRIPREDREEVISLLVDTSSMASDSTEHTDAGSVEM
jgi:hypothetical protein